MSYEKLDILTFGRKLVTSLDLDPIYVGLANLDVSFEQKERWLVCYFCYYHAGVACWMSEKNGDEFWQWMMVAAKNEQPSPTGGRWPRAAERRHFRGAQAVKAIEELQERYPSPEEMLVYIMNGKGHGPISFHDIFERVKEHRGFGQWISFKAADMVDRCLGIPVSFNKAAVFMFKDPMMAVDMLWKENFGEEQVEREYKINAVLDYLQEDLGDLLAPPGMERTLNIQEFETILCKWKSHSKGRYPLGKDILEIREGLSPWLSYSKTAQAFLNAVPKELR